MDGKDDEGRCHLTTLQSTANQVLDDMEDKEIVPNKCVLVQTLRIRASEATYAAGSAVTAYIHHYC